MLIPKLVSKRVFAGPEPNDTPVTSLDLMLIQNLGLEYWATVEKELLRVAKKLLIFNLTHPANYKVVSVHQIVTDVPTLETYLQMKDEA